MLQSLYMLRDGQTLSSSLTNLHQISDLQGEICILHISAASWKTQTFSQGFREEQYKIRLRLVCFQQRYTQLKMFGWTGIWETLLWGLQM